MFAPGLRRWCGGGCREVYGDDGSQRASSAFLRRPSARSAARVGACSAVEEVGEALLDGVDVAVPRILRQFLYRHSVAGMAVAAPFRGKYR